MRPLRSGCLNLSCSPPCSSCQPSALRRETIFWREVSGAVIVRIYWRIDASLASPGSPQTRPRRLRLDAPCNAPLMRIGVSFSAVLRFDSDALLHGPRLADGGIDRGAVAGFESAHFRFVGSSRTTAATTGFLAHGCVARIRWQISAEADIIRRQDVQAPWRHRDQDERLSKLTFGYTF